MRFVAERNCATQRLMEKNFRLTFTSASEYVKIRTLIFQSVWSWVWPNGFYVNQPQRIRCLSMPTIRVKENEPFEVAMRRFKRTIEKSGLLTELRAREFYEKPTAERKRKKAAAIKRHYKRLRSMMLPKKLY